jgi:hypothetical protein
MVAGAAAILQSPSGINQRYVARLQFATGANKCSNNIVVYEVVLLGLRKLRTMGVQCCTLKIDSKVIAEQIKKECMAVVHRMENHFKGFTVEHIERAKNMEADELAKAATRKAALPSDVFFQLIKDPSIKSVEPEPRMVHVVQGEDWRAPILAYLCHHYEPDSSTELIKMQ